MPAYRYRAIHKSGRIQQGQMTAANENELIHFLTESGFELIEAKSQTSRPFLQRLYSWNTRPSIQQKILFCSQMEDLLRAGTPLLTALQTVIDVTLPGEWRNQLSDIARDINHGALIGTAFSKYPQLFDRVFIAILAAGEASGDLPTTFAQLTQQLRWQARISELFRRALRYPLFLLCVATGVTIFMMTMVVPQVVNLLQSIDSNLPFVTRLLIGVSSQFATGWWLGLLGLMVIIAGLCFLHRTSATAALVLDGWLLLVPGLGPTLRKLAIARFVFSFTILLRSGHDLPASLNIASAVLGNRALMSQANYAHQNLLDGQTFSAASMMLFPPFVRQMLHIGEQSGQLVKTLDEVNRFYEHEVTTTVERFIGALEPALTIMVGGLLAWIVLAVLGPIYSNLGKISQGMMRNINNFLLIIGDDGALLVPPQNAKVAEPLFVAGYDEIQTQPLIEVMTAQPDIPVLVLADTLAQEYRLETVPKLNWLDRRKVLARRLRQHFPQAILAEALPMRKNHSLLTCLHEGGPLQDWLALIKNLPNPSRGICLLPLESTGMLTRLLPNPKTEWALLISWQRTGGFRQIVTHHGELVFTRLTPSLPLNSSAPEIATALGRDLQASLGYLARLGLNNSQQLAVVALMPEAAHETLTNLALPIASLTLFSPHKAAHFLNLVFAPSPTDPTSDLLHAAWLLQKNQPRLMLMPPEIRQLDQNRRINKWGRLAAAACWLLTGGYIGWQGQDLLQLSLNNRTQQAGVTMLKQQLATERTTLAPVTEPLGRLRQAIERQRLFTTPTPVPWPLLAKLDQTLGEEARLTKLQWRSDPENLQMAIRLTDVKEAKPEQRQNISQQFDRVAKLLGQNLSAYDVEIIHYPFPVGSEEILSNDKNTSVTSIPTADFKLTKVRP